jgi:hypothetical protein
LDAPAVFQPRHSACPRAAHYRPTQRSITAAIAHGACDEVRHRQVSPEPSGYVLQIELGSMEAFPVAAVDGDAVPDPDFIGDGALGDRELIKGT